MKYLISLCIGTILLAGCSKESESPAKPVDAAVTDKSAVPVDTETTDPKPAELDAKAVTAPGEHADHEGHASEAMAAANLEPYIEVDGKTECVAPEVIEFFAYHCPHCYSLEPAAMEWREKNKGKVNFRAIPTDLGYKQFGPYLLVHHAAKALNVLDKTQHALFERFHEEKKMFGSADEAAEFLAAQGADKAKALALLNDPKLMSESIEDDFKLLQSYQVTSVPQILVNQAYVTDITRAKGHKEVFLMVDELLAKPGNCNAAKTEQK